MKRWVGLAISICMGCAARNAGLDAAGKAVKKAEEIASGFVNADSLALDYADTYYVSGLDAEGKGIISRWKKGDTSVFIRGLSEPSGIVVDPRRKLLFVNDGKTAKIFKIKDPVAPPVSIEVPVRNRLGDVTFSLMNRKAYLSADGECRIWQIDPKTNELKETLPEEVLGSLGLGFPERLFASTDGVRLFLTMKGEKGAAFVSVDLKRRKPIVIREYSDTSELTGLDFMKGHFVFVSPSDPRVRGLYEKDASEVELNPPDGLLHHPKGLVMDSTVAVVLDEAPEDGSSRLVQIPFHFKN